MDAQMECSATPAVGSAEFAYFRDLIHSRAGIALKESKRGLLAARLGRRLGALGLDSFAGYRRYLETSDAGGVELATMLNCMTTNKTSFFREAAHFGVFSEHLRTTERSGQPIYRVWSAACSTGEEPYSIAMTALEARRRLDVRILASDLDTDVLARAEQATYPMESLDEMAAESRHRYFLRGCEEREGWVLVKPEVRELIAFRQINLVAEAWPIHALFDAIFCRNVIIYFDRDTQRRLFERLVQYLAPGGLLFVGHAETLFWLNDLLIPAGQSVYRARNSRGQQA
jgi:chemotaxis protein methyltransferase CheR